MATTAESMEQVFVVDRAAFFGGDWPQGFVPLAAPAATDLLARAEAAGRFEPRPKAEQTPAWKQWIPYCVLRCTHNGLPTGIFHVRRSSGQGETRLHGLLSIGLGGHIEPRDAAPDRADGGFFRRALRRELHEELHLDLPAGAEPRFVGVLNDDATEVGSVHAGLVYVLDLEATVAAANQAVTVREVSKMAGAFGHLAEFDDLWQDPQQFETWSQFLIRAGVPAHKGDFPRSRPGNAIQQTDG